MKLFLLLFYIFNACANRMVLVVSIEKVNIYSVPIAFNLNHVADQPARKRTTVTRNANNFLTGFRAKLFFHMISGNIILSKK